MTKHQPTHSPVSNTARGEPGPNMRVLMIAGAFTYIFAVVLSLFAPIAILFLLIRLVN